MSSSAEHHPSKSTLLPGKGIWLLLGLVLLGGCFVIYGFWQIWSTVTGFERQYLSQGYHLQQGKNLSFTEPIQEDSFLYARDRLDVEQGATANLAIIAHEAFVAGTVQGNLAFMGGDLEIQDGAVIEGSIDVVMAHNVVNRGEVRGGITGTWTRLFESLPPSDEAVNQNGSSTPP